MRGWYKNKGKEPKFDKPVEVIFNGGQKDFMKRPRLFWWELSELNHTIKYWRYVKET